jgi:uncharacterized protein
MKRDYLVFAANMLLACAAAIALLTPKVAQSLQLEQSPNSGIAGNPIEDRITLPTAPRQAGRPSVQPLKDQIALQAEIDNLKALAKKFAMTNPSNVARGNQAAILQKRQTANAAWVLGLLYANGLGVELDYSEAHIRFKQAHQLGEPLATAGLAWCDIQGCEGLPSAHQARMWLGQLRAVKPGRALYLDWLVENTFSPLQNNSAASATSLEKTRLQRHQLLLNAAKTQDVQALIELGFEAVASERLKDAQTYFLTAASQSAVAAKNAQIIANRQNDQKPYCQIANNTDLPDNMILQVAQAMHRGDACPVNYIDAIRLYNLASGKGNLAAKRMLSLIYSKPLSDGNINVNWMQQLANLDVGNLSINISSANLISSLQREPTALYDLIPIQLRTLANSK